jgi:hypothetical protein
VSVPPRLFASSSIVHQPKDYGLPSRTMAENSQPRKLVAWIATPLLISAALLYLVSNSHHLQCSIVSQRLPGKVFYPESTVYTTSLASYWSTFESNLKPKCVIQPQDTQDVAITMQSLSWLPLKSSCKLAVRGGGHTPWAGSANIEGGITLDLSALRTISVSDDRSSVSVGAGNVWGDVYKRTDQEGLAVVGGRGSSIGVGGLTLGGKMNYPSIANGDSNA